MLPLWEWLYRYYFRVQSDGWQNVPASGKMLVVGSHNGGLATPDMFMFLYEWFRRYGTERLAYGLMHPTVWKVSPDLASMAVQCGAVKAHPKMAIAALRKNAPVLVYPGGAQDTFRPYHLRRIGPLPHLPLPVQIRTRVCAPIVFERYGAEAARDRNYVDACFDRVTTEMQLELDRLASEIV